MFTKRLSATPTFLCTPEKPLNIFLSPISLFHSDSLHLPSFMRSPPTPTTIPPSPPVVLVAEDDPRGLLAQVCPSAFTSRQASCIRLQQSPITCQCHFTTVKTKVTTDYFTKIPTQVTFGNSQVTQYTSQLAGLSRIVKKSLL